jgi:hypothetical protein
VADLSQLTTEQLRELRQAGGDASKISTETLRAMKAAGIGRWQPQPHTEATMKEAGGIPGTTRVEPAAGGVNRAVEIFMDPLVKPTTSALDWAHRNVAGGLTALNPFTDKTGEQAYREVLGRQQKRAAHEPPPLEPKTGLESALSWTGAGLGEIALMVLGGELAAGSKLPYLAKAGEFLATQPGVQALAATAGAAGTDITGSPGMGAILGMGTGLAGMTVAGGLKRAFFSDPKTLSDADRLFKTEYLKRMKENGLTIEDLRRRLDGVRDDVPLAAADPTLSSILKDTLNRPGLKEELGLVGPQKPSAMTRADAFARGALKEKDPIEEAKALRDYTTKHLGSPANMAKWEADIEKMISKEHEAARKDILHKTVDEAKIAELNRIFEKNPNVKAVYDQLMGHLRGTPEYAPALPDPAGPGTHGLTEDLLDRFTRMIRDPAFANLADDESKRRAINQLTGDMGAKISADLGKLQGPEVAAWKQRVGWLKGLQDATEQGKKAALDASRGNTNRDQVIEMINNLPRSTDGKVQPQMLDVFRKAYTDAMLTHAGTNPGKAIEQLPGNANFRDVTRAVFGDKKAEEFYKALEKHNPAPETTKLAKDIGGKLDKTTPEEPGGLVAKLGTGLTHAYQAIRHWIGPMVKDIVTVGSSQGDPLRFAPVRDLAARRGLESGDAAKKQMVEDLLKQGGQAPDYWSGLASRVLNKVPPVAAGATGGYQPYIVGMPEEK